jgi:beta-D-xylosidase 4
VEEEKVGGIGLDQGLAAMTAKETIILSCMLLCLLLLATQVFEKPKTVVYKLQYACDPDGRADVLFPFCNTSWSDEDRVTDLISRLTIFEKIEQLVNTAANVSRVGLPAYQWWGEGLHGVAISPSVHFGGDTPAATSFPSPILSAASYNRTLWNKIAQVGLKFLLGNAVCGKTVLV